MRHLLLITLIAMLSSCHARMSHVTMNQLLRDEKAEGARIILARMSEKEINQAIDDFMSLYADNNPVRPVVRKENESYVLQLPDSTDYAMFCFWVNYIVYSNKEKRYNNDVLGWYEVCSDAVGVWRQFAGQKLMFFIPESDSEFNNVFFTTEDNQSFKQEFAFWAKLIPQQGVLKYWIDGDF